MYLGKIATEISILMTKSMSDPGETANSAPLGSQGWGEGGHNTSVCLSGTKTLFFSGALRKMRTITQQQVQENLLKAPWVNANRWLQYDALSRRNRLLNIKLGS